MVQLVCQLARLGTVQSSRRLPRLLCCAFRGSIRVDRYCSWAFRCRLCSWVPRWCWPRCPAGNESRSCPKIRQGNQLNCSAHTRSHQPTSFLVEIASRWLTYWGYSRASGSFRSRFLKGTELEQRYRFEFIKVGTILDLSILSISKERCPEASDDGLSISIFDGKGSHLHGWTIVDLLLIWWNIIQLVSESFLSNQTTNNTNKDKLKESNSKGFISASLLSYIWIRSDIYITSCRTSRTILTVNTYLGRCSLLADQVWGWDINQWQFAIVRKG